MTLAVMNENMKMPLNIVLQSAELLLSKEQNPAS